MKYFSILLALLLIYQCNKPSSSSEKSVKQSIAANKVTRKHNRKQRLLFTSSSRFGMAGNSHLISSKVLSKAKSKTIDKDKEQKDYWKNIQFNENNFDEILSFVSKYYIDKKYDKTRAYAEASNFAISSIPDAKLSLIPENFYNIMKTSKEFDEYKNGTFFKLKKSDKFIIFKAKDKKKKKSKRLSDDELRKEKAKWKKRDHLLEQEWKKINFTRDKFLRVINYIKNLEKKNPKIKMNKIWVAAGQGYLFSLDPHSALVNKESWDNSMKETEDASFDGIGAVLTKRGDDIIIESPIEGQPAVKAGLKPGDIILKVDGVPVSGKELMDVVKMIRGPRGTKVTLTVQRFGEPENLNITIIRAHINIPNVQFKLVKYHKDMGYVKITGFVETTTDKLEDAINELIDKTKSGKLRGLILDLRYNPGGLLDAAVTVSDLFLKKGVIVSVKNSVNSLFFKKKNEEIYKAHPDDTFTFPLVVLVNDGSASAAEIVSSAMQENGRGIIVGDRTFGKASVQTLFNAVEGSGYYIKLTISRYYSPTGRTIQLTGVIPDFYVPEEPGKKMPVGFREEDLSHHLSAITFKNKFISPNTKYKDKIKKCLKSRGIAEKLDRNNPNPSIKFDYQLYKAADILECDIDLTN